MCMDNILSFTYFCLFHSLVGITFFCSFIIVYASLNFGSKTQPTFGNQTERISSYSGPNPSPGAFILPSYPLSSRTSPKHTCLTVSPKKSQDNSVNFSNSWPLKSFEGLSKPSPQKKLVSQKSSGSTGRNDGKN